MLDNLTRILITFFDYFLGCFHWNCSPIYLLYLGIIILVTVEIVLPCAVNIIMQSALHALTMRFLYVNVFILSPCRINSTI